MAPSTPGNGGAWQRVPAPNQGWRPTPDYYAQGYLGQFIYVAPEKQMVIVRFGREPGRDYWWPGLMARIAEMN